MCAWLRGSPKRETAKVVYRGTGTKIPLSFCSPPSVTVPHFSLAASLPAVVTPNAPMSSYGVAGSLSGGASRGGGGDVGAGIGTTLKPSHNT